MTSRTLPISIDEPLAAAAPRIRVVAGHGAGTANGAIASASGNLRTVPQGRTRSQGAVGARALTELLLRARARLPAGHPDRDVLRAWAIEDNLPLAARLARSYSGRGEQIEDLVQVAALALVRAVDGFDPDRRAPFSSYAVPSIVGALKRHFRDNTWGMHVPRSTQQVFLQLPAAIGDLTHRSGRAPTSIELADHLGIDITALLAATKAAHAYRLLSLDAAGNGVDALEVVDALGGIDPRFAAVEDWLTFAALVVGLPSMERQVLVLRFYDEWTQSQIAAEIGVSQMQVSRLLQRSLTHLRAGFVAAVAASPEEGPPMFATDLAARVGVTGTAGETGRGSRR